MKHPAFRRPILDRKTGIPSPKRLSTKAGRPGVCLLGKTFMVGRLVGEANAELRRPRECANCGNRPTRCDSSLAYPPGGTTLIPVLEITPGTSVSYDLHWRRGRSSDGLERREGLFLLLFRGLRRRRGQANFRDFFSVRPHRKPRCRRTGRSASSPQRLFRSTTSWRRSTRRWVGRTSGASVGSQTNCSRHRDDRRISDGSARRIRSATE